MSIENTQHIAVDLVLLPAEAHLKHIIAINNSIDQPTDKRILLAEAGNLPHISLFMGCMQLSSLSMVRECMKIIAGKFSVFDLFIKSLAFNNGVASLDIESNSLLLKLHEEIITTVKIHFSARADEHSIYGGEKGLPGTLEWINNFLSQNSYEKFWPHITLGYGKTTFDELKVNPIRADKLALFHLSNHCTCQKLLASFPLKGN